MAYSSKQLAKALIAIIARRPDKTDEIAKNFIDFCKKKNLLNQLPKVVEYIKIEKQSKESLDKLWITTYTTPNKTIINEIKKLVGISNDVEIGLLEDKTLQGGIIAKYKGKIYDGSVSSQLAALKSKLKY